MLARGFLVMGVAGSGKSTLGRLLAQELGWVFFDADDFHSVGNIAKMTAGLPLSDSDRAPWLAALNRQLRETLSAGGHPVLACSALKEEYRARLLEGTEGMATIYLKGSFDLLRSRLSARQGHYMKADLLPSQFEALEEPRQALMLDASLPLSEMLDTITVNYFTGKRPPR